MNPLGLPDVIGIAGDWHMNLPWAVKAIEYMAKNQVDTVLHTGDLWYDFKPDFMAGVEAALAKHKMNMLAVDGNHEDHEFLYSYPVQRATGLRKVTPHVYHIPRGKRWKWDGVRFMGLGGAHSVDRGYRIQQGYLWSYQELISEKDVRRALRGGQVDVLLSHDCPASVPIPNLSKTSSLFPAEEIKQSEAHRQYLEDAVVRNVKPYMIFHGHYHRKYKVGGNFFDYGPVSVMGLDCDGTTMQDNIKIVKMQDLKRALVTGGGV